MFSLIPPRILGLLINGGLEGWLLQILYEKSKDENIYMKKAKMKILCGCQRGTSELCDLVKGTYLFLFSNFSSIKWEESRAY